MNAKVDFNYFWNFTKTGLSSTYNTFEKESITKYAVTLPHDWLIYDTTNLYENSIGWYEKTFDPQEYFDDYTEEDSIIIRFDGVYMDSTIYLNGQQVGEWKYGYTTFEVDLTTAMKKGENHLLVKVRHESPNSRWYSGAGIYRKVWLIKKSANSILSDGIYVHMTEENDVWQVEIDTELKIEEDCFLEQSIYDGQECIGKQKLGVGAKNDENLISVEQCLEIEAPILWSVDNPKLYRLETTLSVGACVVEKVEQNIGFKSVKLTADQGFFLNGRPMKLKGVCEHHDLGCFGAVFNKTAMRRRLILLKQMGVNAIRCAHNMPAPEVMALCDELGLMVVTESFDMWHQSKTPYDYSRFFEEWAERDVERWVKRDRNHVSLIMWSIGNEIFDTHMDEKGQVTTKRLMNYVKHFDYKMNGTVTIGSNYMPWENAQKCADLVKVAGYNYGEKYYAKHHEEHPDWMIYGSETSSIVQSRGIYHFPLSKSILSDDDMQCSALGNSTTSWGAKSLESCIGYDATLNYSLGQFIWTGFDYIGEPTPYHTKNSYFGQIDTAGFPKDSYYVYQAAWTNRKENPMIHLFPYWDFNQRQKMDVRVCSNAYSVELFLNDQSLGEQCLENDRSDRKIIADWQVEYKEGILEAVAYDENHIVIAKEKRYSFGNGHSIIANMDKINLIADGEDVIFIELGVVDEQGRLIENANRRMNVSLIGEGVLIGMDNGDSTDYDGYKSNSRRLFSGKCLLVIGATLQSGEIKVVVESEGLPTYTCCIESLPTTLRGEKAKATSCKRLPRSGCSDSPNKASIKLPMDMAIRKIKLDAVNGNLINGKEVALPIHLHCYPSKAMKQELHWRVVDDAGIDSNIGRIRITDQGCMVSAVGDGNFRVRCMVNNGKEHPDIISQLEFVADGIGVAYKNPYHFISGGLYDGVVGEATNGNERGVATARDGKTIISYEAIDFGTFGSDEITIPIFALDDQLYEIELWEGVPGSESFDRIDTLKYQKPSRWNVYQEETYTLPKRLKGITAITFAVKGKIHIKGFSFKKLNKAYEQIAALDYDMLYGDSYEVQSWGIASIGNNVTLVFGTMTFGEDGACAIEVCGRSNKTKNMIRIQTENEDGQTIQNIEIEASMNRLNRTYPIKKITGTCKVEFIFLPGSDFDFEWFRFIK